MPDPTPSLHDVATYAREACELLNLKDPHLLPLAVKVFLKRIAELEAERDETLAQREIVKERASSTTRILQDIADVIHTFTFQEKVIWIDRALAARDQRIAELEAASRKMLAEFHKPGSFEYGTDDLFLAAKMLRKAVNG